MTSPQSDPATHWHSAAKFSPRTAKAHASLVAGFNTKLAVWITHLVGSMWCAYAFGLLALIGLPDAIKLGVLAIIQWVAQTFLQLVLLSIIMVGQQVQSGSSDARFLKTAGDVELALDRLDPSTVGGIQVLVDVMHRIEARLATLT